MALCNFQPHKLQVVKDFMRDNVFPLYKVIEDFGIILCSAITIFILLLALYFLYKAFNKNEKVKKAVLGMK